MKPLPRCKKCRIIIGHDDDGGSICRFCDMEPSQNSTGDNQMSLNALLQLLCDPENQPHQFVGCSKDLENHIFAALYKDSYPADSKQIEAYNAFNAWFDANYEKEGNVDLYNAAPTIFSYLSMRNPGERITELLEANNKLLERAREAEHKLKQYEKDKATS